MNNDDLHLLHDVRVIVTHDNCADGTASAILLHDALPNARVIFLQHGTRPFAELPAEPGMLFCDLSPPKDRVQEFVKAGAIVLDHHKTARDVVEAFGMKGIFGDEVVDKGVSGAVLAYREVWLPIFQERAQKISAMPDLSVSRSIAKTVFYRELVNYVCHFAELAGIRDTWQKNHLHWRAACEQSEALRFFPNEDWLNLHQPWAERALALAGSSMHNGTIVRAIDMMLSIGPTLLKKHEEAVANVVKKALRVTTDRGTNVVIFEGPRYTSDAAEIAEADLVIGFHYEVEDNLPKMILSTRSRGNFDCSKLASFFGGGGHTQAAGFSMVVASGHSSTLSRFNGKWIVNGSPYQSVRQMIEVYQNDQVHAHEESA